MNLYWVLSNIIQYLLLLMLLIIFYLPQKYFGSQNYSGYGQIFCMIILLFLFDIAVINSFIAGCISYSKGIIGKKHLWYAIVQVLFFTVLNYLLFLRK